MREAKKVALLIETSNRYGRDLLYGVRDWMREGGKWAVRFTEQARGAAVPQDLVNATAATVTPADPGVLFFSSGSTAKPKGILSAHRGVTLQLWRWKRYYAAIFNPARLKVKAMLKEMPKKYWANMPETALVRELVKKGESTLDDITGIAEQALDVKNDKMILPRIQRLAKKSGIKSTRPKV